MVELDAGGMHGEVIRPGADELRRGRRHWLAIRYRECVHKGPQRRICSRPRCEGGYLGNPRNTKRRQQSFMREEKECPVFYDLPAERAAEVVVTDLGLWLSQGIGEPVISVEKIISEVFIEP